jgi:hypothetical protein
MFNINNFIPDLSAITEGLSLIAQSTMNTQDIVKNITESLQSIVEMQQSFVLQIEKQVTQVLSQFSLFSYTEEKREEIRVAICKWGEYGWTIPEHANMYEFMEKPISAKEANNIASKYCTNEYMDKLFENIKKFGCVRQSDFSEAIENYRDKRYKSCACIMFSLIDAKLIRMQPREELGRPVNRFVGKKAVEKSKEKIINTKSNIKNTLFSILRLENVYSCLMKFFEKGNNFEKQPEVINRNFLVHGMLIRQVTKRDCKQLFLLYYNWLSLLER